MKTIPAHYLLSIRLKRRVNNNSIKRKEVMSPREFFRGTHQFAIDNGLMGTSNPISTPLHGACKNNHSFIRTKTLMSVGPTWPLKEQTSTVDLSAHTDRTENNQSQRPISIGLFDHTGNMPFFINIYIILNKQINIF